MPVDNGYLAVANQHIHKPNPYFIHVSDQLNKNWDRWYYDDDLEGEFCPGGMSSVRSESNSIVIADKQDANTYYIISSTDKCALSESRTQVVHLNVSKWEGSSLVDQKMYYVHSPLHTFGSHHNHFTGADITVSGDLIVACTYSEDDATTHVSGTMALFKIGSNLQLKNSHAFYDPFLGKKANFMVSAIPNSNEVIIAANLIGVGGQKDGVVIHKIDANLNKTNWSPAVNAIISPSRNSEIIYHAGPDGEKVHTILSDVLALNERDFLITGFYLDEEENTDSWIIKLSSDGTVDWEKYGFVNNSQALPIDMVSLDDDPSSVFVFSRKSGTSYITKLSTKKELKPIVIREEANEQDGFHFHVGSSVTFDGPEGILYDDQDEVITLATEHIEFKFGLDLDTSTTAGFELDPFLEECESYFPPITSSIIREAPSEHRFRVATLLVYPNPSQQSFHVDYDFQKSNDVIIRVYTMEGIELRKVTQSGVLNLREKINLGELASGVYLLSVSSNELNTTRRIVLKK